jgi:hypothetical protein
MGTYSAEADELFCLRLGHDHFGLSRIHDDPGIDRDVSRCDERLAGCRR